MDAEERMQEAAARLAGAIGEPARARMLYLLMDGRARTCTELALVAKVSPSTASVHLARLRGERLVRVAVQGRHRYYSLGSDAVGDVLERLSSLTGLHADSFAPSTPIGLRAARTCYDHIAGALGVTLHDRLIALGWLAASTHDDAMTYEVAPRGAEGFCTLGVDVRQARALRRRFAYACVDWSERRAHLGGALAAALLAVALEKKWLTRDRNSRALSITQLGERDLLSRLGIRQPPGFFAGASGSSTKRA